VDDCFVNFHHRIVTIINMCQMRRDHTFKEVQNVSGGLRQLIGQARANYEARQYNHQIKGVEGCKLPRFFLRQRFGNGVPNLPQTNIYTPQEVNIYKDGVCTIQSLYTSFFLIIYDTSSI
jgi:hypothetical protein